MCGTAAGHLGGRGRRGAGQRDTWLFLNGCWGSNDTEQGAGPLSDGLAPGSRDRRRPAPPPPRTPSGRASPGKGRPVCVASVPQRVRRGVGGEGGGSCLCLQLVWGRGTPWCHLSCSESGGATVPTHLTELHLCAQKQCTCGHLVRPLLGGLAAGRPRPPLGASVPAPSRSLPPPQWHPPCPPLPPGGISVRAKWGIKVSAPRALSGQSVYGKPRASGLVSLKRERPPRPPQRPRSPPCSRPAGQASLRLARLGYLLPF